MKVVQVCISKFHHFDLAKQLYQQGLLERFYTGYPGFKLKEEGLPPGGKVTTFPWLMTPRMALAKFGLLPTRFEQPLHRWVQETLDAYVAATMPECDVLFALSGSGLRSGRLARQRGGVFVCDRGSSHIRYQDAILKEEFARWGDSFVGINAKTMANEEAEYAAADAIVVPSEFVYRSFIQMGVPAAKLRKIPYGVNLNRFAKVADPSSQSFDVLFVGQAGFRKGVPYLLQAFARLRHPNKRLRIVGSMSREMLRYLANKPPPENVELLGHVPQPQLKEIMSRSHVMVLPSIEEGLALVQAQAMACGCPVIGTFHTGAEDLFADGIEGFIVAPRDPAAITERLQQLADEPDKRQVMSEAALRKVQLIGGWDHYGTLMETTLRGLVNMRISSPVTETVI